MEWLQIKTGYSFKAVFGHVDEIIKRIKGPNCRFAGIADINSTFGHVAWSKACRDADIKPVFGVQLTVCDRPKEKSRSPQFRRNLMTFVATSRQGVEEIYHLVDLAHSQFYHMPLLTYDQLNKTTLNLLVLSGLAPDFEKITRDIHLQMSPDLPRALVYSDAFPRIACIDNWYPTKKDKTAYETFASNAYSYESKTSPMHILDDAEWLEIFPNHLDAIKNRNVFANICSGVELPRAPFISVGAHSVANLKADCFQGAKRKGQHKDKQAMARLDYELKLIENKGFEDYFLVVADLIKWAKTKMVVGPGRGSSAGSIVCYFLGITTVNPLDYGLLFERFIDINRTDLPDIDIDFQDDKREMVLGYLKEKYGVECVAQIGNVSKLKPKSAFNRAAKALRIDSHLISEFKESIEERPEGDKRERFAIKDAMKTTDLGRAFKKTFKNMAHVHQLEGHPSHSSIHAGGVLVCTEPVGNFCGINSRDPKKRVAMIDKRDAEELNLLKIDALGLKTLTVLAEVCEIIRKPYSWLEGIPLDDKKVFKMINKNDFTGIFQMEGDAFRGLAERMTVKTLEEMADLSALCRPGPLMAGSAEKYVKIKSGDRAPKYICNHKVIIEQTRETMGLIIYQEQIMAICKEFGQMSWPSVIKVRKMMGKSMGDEAFQAYKKEFMKGALSNKATKKEALEVWEAMENFGKYGFNKCISGSTKIRIAHGNQHLKGEISAEELYQMYVENPKPGVKSKKRQPTLISFDGERGVPQMAKGIYKNGYRLCHEFSFNDGSVVTCTMDHKFLINEKWQPISKAKIGSEFLFLERDDKYLKKGRIAGITKSYGSRCGFPNGEKNPSFVNGKTPAKNNFFMENEGMPCQRCDEFLGRMEIHHKDFDSGHTNPYDLSWLCVSCHKKIHYDAGRTKAWRKGYKPIAKKLVKIKEIGKIMTYDIEMPTYHNFMLANGLITHNSHAVVYSIISYLTAYMKTYHLKEFAVGLLNNSNNTNSCVKLLRKLVETGVKYSPLDIHNSQKKWSIHKGVLIGGLLSVEGLGPQKANTVLKCRREGTDLPEGIEISVQKLISPFKFLYPGRDIYGEYYKKKKGNYGWSKATKIKNIKKDGEFLFIGKLIKKTIKNPGVSGAVSRSGKTVKSDTYISAVFEDDTGAVNAIISRKMFAKGLGEAFLKQSTEDLDWFHVLGDYSTKGGFKTIFIRAIHRITKEI